MEDKERKERNREREIPPPPLQTQLPFFPPPPTPDPLLPPLATLGSKTPDEEGLGERKSRLPVPRGEGEVVIATRPRDDEVDDALLLLLRLLGPPRRDRVDLAPPPSPPPSPPRESVSCGQSGGSTKEASSRPGHVSHLVGRVYRKKKKKEVQLIVRLLNSDLATASTSNQPSQKKYNSCWTHFFLKVKKVVNRCHLACITSWLTMVKVLNLSSSSLVIRHVTKKKTMSI